MPKHNFIDRKMVKKLRKTGLTYRLIAKKLKCSIGGVQHALKK